jgi:hypothetical protein
MKHRIQPHPYRALKFTATSVRIVPHDQYSAAFFIAVYQKLSTLNGIFPNPSISGIKKNPYISYVQIILTRRDIFTP